MSTHSIPGAAAAHDVEAAEHDEVHITPLRIYFGVWAALLVFTGITVAVSYFDFGEFNLFVALIVAVIKGSLVAAYFMHLKWDNKINTAFFGASLLFVGIFFYLVFADTNTRGQVDQQQGSFVNHYLKKADAPAKEGGQATSHH